MVAKSSWNRHASTIRAGSETLMAAQPIQIICPCCSNELIVDVTTRTASRASSSPAAKPKERDPWNSAQEKVRGRTDSGTEKLENALREERGKSSKLDQLFKDAQSKLKRGDDEGA